MPNRWVCLFDAETILKSLRTQLEAESLFPTVAEVILRNAEGYITRQMAEVARA